MIARELVALSIVIGLLSVLSGCTGAWPTDPVQPRIELGEMTTEPVRVDDEVVSQYNCNGNAEVDYEIRIARTVERVVEANGNIAATGEVDVKPLGVGVNLGGAIAAELGVAYGVADEISRSITVRAAAHSHLEHIVTIEELWKVGTASISVGDKTASVPYRFRSDFQLRLIDTRPMSCPTEIAPPTPAAAIATTTPTASTRVASTATSVPTLLATDTVVVASPTVIPVASATPSPPLHPDIEPTMATNGPTPATPSEQPTQAPEFEQRVVIRVTGTGSASYDVAQHLRESQALLGAETVAKRNLVEWANGAEIEAVTIVESGVLTQDKIKSTVRGIVPRYTIVEQTYDPQTGIAAVTLEYVLAAQDAP